MVQFFLEAVIVVLVLGYFFLLKNKKKNEIRLKALEMKI